jgi:hypothetical protein
MTLDNIKVNDFLTLVNVEYYTKGYLTGYINCMLEDSKTNKWHETLYRIHDPQNGNDYTLISVDYGWKLNDDSLIDLTEKVLTEIAKGLNLNFDELEQKQIEYNIA